MPRQLPEGWRDKEVPEIVRKDNSYITQVRKYKLITPLFGGGVNPQEADPITTVRASEVRGQLRFWWRATRGGQFGGSLEEMKKKEDEIWGSTATSDKDSKLRGGPSQVQITLLAWNKGEADIPYIVEGTQAKPRLKTRPGTSVPAYAAFPLQPERKKQKPGMLIQPVQKDVWFKLQLSFPQSLRADIEAALWAWETFGGMGARTRRGFGALRLVSIDGQAATDLPSDDLQQGQRWLQSKLDQFVQKEDWPDDTPHLTRRMRYKLLKGSNALTVWKELIGNLQKFRQPRRDKNTHNLNQYGHSDWPEPNAIRSAFEVMPRGPHAKRRIVKYPRAQFGLPIVFHMAHDLNLDATLEGNAGQRLASPLILKPLACHGDQALGLAMILEGVRLPKQVVLRADSGNSFPADPSVTAKEAGQIPPLNGQTDVLQAFLDTLK